MLAPLFLTKITPYLATDFGMNGSYSLFPYLPARLVLLCHCSMLPSLQVGVVY
jgi:hypothetical protein